MDSVNDEKRLLSTIKQNADRGIYTTVVGIGMVMIALITIHHSYRVYTVYLVYKYIHTIDKKISRSILMNGCIVYRT